MTGKQRRFVDEYLISANATAAAKKAGYSARGAKQVGSLLLKNEVVQSEIQARMAIRGADANEVIDFLTQVMRDDSQKMHFRLKAAELLGKRHGLFTERVSIAKSGDAEIVIDAG